MDSIPSNEGIEDGFCGGIWFVIALFPDALFGAIILISKRFNLLVFYSISIKLSLITGVESDFFSIVSFYFLFKFVSAGWLMGGLWIYSMTIWLLFEKTPID